MAASVMPELSAVQDHKAQLGMIEKESAPEKVNDLGLTASLEAALLKIVEKLESENYPTWKGYFRDFLEAEAFWKDLQNGYYDKDNDAWRVPSAEDLLQLRKNGQRFTFVTNEYRSWGWSLISVLGQKVPTTRFFPKDFRKPEDVLKARRANDVAPLIARNNRVKLQNLKVAYLLYTCGVAGTYTRYVVDKERFGTKKVPQYAMQPVELAPGGYVCPECMADVPGEEAGVMVCPECGAPMNEADYQPPVMGEAPMQVGEKEVPCGQEVITTHGGLELRLPPWTDQKEARPFLGLVNETHISMLRKMYGDKAKGLAGGSGSGDANASYDRYARLSLTEANVGYHSSSNTSLVTVRQYWLRPCMFTELEGDDSGENRKELEKLFPDGVKITIADQKVLDAKPENMDAHWEICSAHEGTGAYKPALGSSAISINKRTNLIHNFIMEFIEYAAAGAGGIVNVGMLNIGAVTETRQAPGRWHPVKISPNIPLSNVIQENKPGQMAGEVFGYHSELRTLGRDLTGAQHTLSGGTDRSLKPTTYIADREQAIGKMFGPWSHMQELWAGTFGKAVAEYSKYRNEDEAFTLPGKVSGDYEGRLIPINEIRDGDTEVYPEVNELFPALWHQMQAMYLKLMESNDPYLKEIMGHGRNIEFAKAMLGLPDVYIPGQDDRLKQQIEIKELLVSQPEVMDGGMDPATLTPLPPTILPSIPPDEFEDDHEEHFLHVKEWAVSPEGLVAKQTNPGGYLNVIAHGRAHEEILKKRAMEAAMAAQVAAPGDSPAQDGRSAALDGAMDEIEGNVNEGTSPE